VATDAFARYDHKAIELLQTVLQINLGKGKMVRL